MARHFSDLPEFRAGGMRRAAFHASAGTLPFQGHAIGNKAIDCFSHVGEPCGFAAFSLSVTTSSPSGLAFRDLKNRAIFRGKKLFEWWYAWRAVLLEPAAIPAGEADCQCVERDKI